MIPESRLTENQQKRVKELSKKFPKTGRAYRMVQVLDEMYKCSRPADAEVIFNRLIS
jgi:transposase